MQPTGAKLTELEKRAECDMFMVLLIHACAGLLCSFTCAKTNKKFFCLREEGSELPRPTGSYS
jgi:hypothetical protein